MTIKVIHYLNQFFGQKGGEEVAHLSIEYVNKPVGPGVPLVASLSEKIELVGTIICGDSWFNENQEEACAGIKEILQQEKPDLIIAGPAFNAGRYGMACGNVAQVAHELGIDTISGMYPENPGHSVFQPYLYAVETGNSAATMRSALADMAKLVEHYLENDKSFAKPAEAGYMPRGVRVNYFAEENGAKRAVDMLLKRIEGKPFTPEFDMPVYDRVPPQPAIKDLSKATIALISSGGVIPFGNPDRIESSSASKFGIYDISGKEKFVSGEWETVHGGYDPVACNADPNRVAPIDVLRELETEGKIGKLFDKYIATVGTGTPVSNAESFGQEIAMILKNAGISAAILTST